MARTKREATRPGGEAERPARKRERPGKAKITMWVDEEIARKLRALRGWEGQELGEIAGPILKAGLSSWYVAERSSPAKKAAPETPAVRLAPPPEPADPPEGESGETAA